MDSIGAEVGQKMRSAIKAKLLELECYVDDELPDYIMVMVANKRTKSQMNEDLNLFLASKTSTFVNWLHIVLKKLKEVTVTNPEVYKKVSGKRKTTDEPDVKVKKEKKDKLNKKIKKEGQSSHANVKTESNRSLTDDLPITANKLAEQRKISLLHENKTSDHVVEDSFDIPLLSEVSGSNEQELEDIEKKIKNVKSRLGMLVQSDEEEEDLDNLDLKKERDKLLSKMQKSREAALEQNKQMCLEKEQEERQITQESTTPEHRQISFGESMTPPRKPSILDRLGKRPSDTQEYRSTTPPPKKKITLSDEHRKNDEKNSHSSHNGSRRYERHHRDSKSSSYRHRRNSSRDRTTSSREISNREEHRDRSDTKKSEPKKESVLSRLGVKSKVYVPDKPPEEPELKEAPREVPSLIKVKPRVIPNDVQQPNKNLLLKAVAEAQRSVAQAPKVGKKLRPDALYTKKYMEGNTKKIGQSGKTKISSQINSKYNTDSDNYDSEGEYIPKPIKKGQSELPEYVPSSKLSESENEIENSHENVKQQFIITLDGADKINFAKKVPAKARLEGRKTPSPIIFDKEELSSVTPQTRSSKSNIPDKLPIIHTPLSVKNKERCKYWPSCRQGDKCEFVHPSSNCEKFPNCKFGEKCLFIHPTCKFGNTCTKRDCPYSHNLSSKNSVSRLRAPPTLQTCKFFPNCSNANCAFYHPKICMYGKYCKNQADCTFSHAFLPNKSNLIWRPK